jgi:hypothetical protein
MCGCISFLEYLLTLIAEFKTALTVATLDKKGDQ